MAECDWLAGEGTEGGQYTRKTGEALGRGAGSPPALPFQAPALRKGGPPQPPTLAPSFKEWDQFHGVQEPFQGESLGYREVPILQECSRRGVTTPATSFTINAEWMDNVRSHFWGPNSAQKAWGGWKVPCAASLWGRPGGVGCGTDTSRAACHHSSAAPLVLAGPPPPAERFRETAVPQGPASALDSANETQKAAALLELTFRVGRVKTVSPKQTLKRILDNEQCYQVNKQVRWGSLQRCCRTGDPGLRAEA